MDSNIITPKMKVVYVQLSLDDHLRRLRNSREALRNRRMFEGQFVLVLISGP